MILSRNEFEVLFSIGSIRSASFDYRKYSTAGWPRNDFISYAINCNQLGFPFSYLSMISRRAVRRIIRPVGGGLNPVLV